MCKAKLVAEQIHAAKERAKAVRHVWFIDLVSTTMIKNCKTNLEFRFSEVEEMYESRGYSFLRLEVEDALDKEGFYTSPITDYDGVVYGFEVNIKTEHLYKV